MFPLAIFIFPALYVVVLGPIWLKMVSREAMAVLAM
jgi:hypothetical protein